MTPKKILICGLPGSGKTTLGAALARAIGAVHLDGDTVREATYNWDFSEAGRKQQSYTMSCLANTFIEQGHSVVASYIAPTSYIRALFAADFTVFMDTIVRAAIRIRMRCSCRPPLPTVRFRSGGPPVTWCGW